MGHRKYSAPRRGSVAFRPRARAQSLEARVRTWPQVAGEKTALLGFAGFKVGGIHVLTIDDREEKNLEWPASPKPLPPILRFPLLG